MWRLLLVLAGCGRLDFGERTVSADAEPDAPPLQHRRIELTSPNAAAGDRFGNAIAVSRDGSTIAIGAPQEQGGAGRVYVYTRPTGTWQLAAHVQAAVPAAGNNFGASVAVSADGSELVVGESRGDAAVTDAGDVVVLSRAGSSWSPVHTLVAAAPDTGDLFGFAVAASSDGSTVVVGAPGEASGATTIDGNATDNSQAMAGAAYVFHGAGATWAASGYLKTPTTASADQLGWAVACSDSGGAIAASRPTTASQTGDVALFRLDGAWQLDASVANPMPTSGDFFGYGIALDALGANLLAGAPGSDLTVSNGGAASGYFRGSTWSRDAQLAATNAADNDQLGTAVAMTADAHVVFVAASLADTGATDAGAVYRFEVIDGTWTQVDELVPQPAMASGEFGYPVAVSSDASVIAIGATGANSAAGAVSILYFGQ